MHSPKKILVVKARSLGDTLLLLASLRLLRETYPRATIDLVVTTAWADLMRTSGYVDQVFSYEHHPRVPARAKALTRLALTLRKERYDWALNFHSSPALAALSYAVGASTRAIHFHGPKLRNLYSTVTIPGKGIAKSALEKDFDVLRALGLSVPENCFPILPVDQNRKSSILNQYRELKLSGPRLLLGLGASRPSKIWPLDRFATLALRWIEESKGHVSVVYTSAESALYQSFIEALETQASQWYQDSKARAQVLSQIIPETDRTLPELAALFATSQIFFGNDSGPKHLAAATGVPSLTVFGPEDPLEWHPYSKDKHQYLYLTPLSCRVPQDPGGRPWCGLNICITEEHRCMRSISESDVFSALIKLWKCHA